MENKSFGFQRRFFQSARMVRVKMKKGLTMVELLVVIVLIGLLILAAAFIAPAQLKKSRDARRKADLQEIKIALYDYYFDHNCFPRSKDFPECGENFGSNGESYLNSFPCDFNGESYVYVSRQGGCSQWFRLFANLEVTTDPIIDKIHCRQGCGPSETKCDYNYGVASANTQVYRNCADTYVCNPGGGCERYEDPWMSKCPVTFGDDSHCGDQCDDPANQCENASGKHVPWE